MSSSSDANRMVEHQHQRHADIWSTRIQRELLALTTDDAEAVSEHTKAMLPPFVSVLEHHLNIQTADCTIHFQVQVVKSSSRDNDPIIHNVVVQLDASVPKASDGSLRGTPPAYPFAEPTVTLLSGEQAFPEGSTISRGDVIGMDIEWTPSLHIADAIMNIGLKIKESILQNEPFHPVPIPEKDAVEQVAQSALRIASSLSQRASNLGKALSPKSRSTPSSKDAIKKSLSAENVRIGDEINLMEEPWVDAHGVYSCNALRRPQFIADAIHLAEEKAEQQTFSSPTSFFRSFTKSARNVMQESYIMITETHIIEMKASKLNPSHATVTFCISIELMHKLKFRRQESLSLFFKPAPEDPLIYMCPDSGDAVYQIQSVLKRHGVKGKHTNAAAHRSIAEAMSLIQEIQTKELALKHDPSVGRVNEIMDLYRQAAERFAVAGDIRHEEVVVHMRKFLALPLTTSILDGTFVKPIGSPMQFSPATGKIPEGEVLERTKYQLEDDDHDIETPVIVRKKKFDKERDKEFEENMNNLLKEAQADLQQLKTDSDGTAETDGDHSSDSALADMAKDLDAMMKQADAELEELMSSE